MRQLLRSMIVVGNDNPDEIFRNFIKFSESGMGFESTQETKIWEVIQSFCQDHNHAPSADSLRGILKASLDVSASDFLEILIQTPALFKGDFLVHLEAVSVERKTRQVKDLLNQTSAILNTGIQVKDEKGTKVYKGPVDAAKYFYDHVPDIVAPTTGGRIFGEVLRDGERGIKNYLTVKADPRAGVGQFTGIEQIDVAIKGAKKHELWTHAAFTGHGKSYFARNWAYNQAVFMGYSVLYLSLEMYYKQMQNHFYSMHSAHSKFNDIRMELGIQKDPRITIGLPYELIREGALNPEEEIFLLQHVIPDLGSEEHGHIFLEVGDPDKDEMTISDLRARAEMIHKKTPIQLIIVDHALLMSPRRRTRSTTEDLNQVMRDLKKLSMSFDRGAGIPVVALFQISREGFKHAEKAEGRYNLTHLSYANECCAEGTLVATDKGWVSIEDVTTGHKVWSRSGWKTVLDTFNQGTRQTVKVSTTGGVFHVTPDHRLRVWNGQSIDWMHAKDLKEGDVIPIPSDYPGVEDSGEYSASYLKGVDSVNPSRPIQGIYLHGHYGLRMGVRRSLYTLFGDRSLNTFSFTPHNESNRLYREVCESEVPESRNHTLCFLRGLLDAGGWVTRQSTIAIALSENSPKELIKRKFREIGVQVLFTDNHFMQITNAIEVRRVAQLCGFSHSPIHRDAYYAAPNTDITLPVSDILRAKYRIEGDVAASNVNELEEFREICSMLITKVVSVEPSISLPVYDIEVDGDHEYMTEFHLAHNCERSSDIVTASWLSDSLKGQNRMQFQCLKVRDGGSFEPFYARTDFSVGRLFTCHDSIQTDEQREQQAREIEIENMLP